MIWIIVVLALVAGIFLFIKFGQKAAGISPPVVVLPPAVPGAAPQATVAPAEVVMAKEKQATSILAHIQNWASAYWWVPISLIAVILLAKFSFFLTGRKPLDNGIDWTGMAEKFFTCILIILLLEITREATGIWLTKEEAKLHVSLAWAQRVKTMFMAALFVYVFFH